MMWRKAALIGCILVLISAVLVGNVQSAWARPHTAPMACSGLFISEYVEGSSNNKAVEIYNGTGLAVNLSGYSIAVYANGGTTPTAINLTGTVADGDVFVLANTSSGATLLTLADQTSGSLSHNGDDAIALRQGTTLLDVIGQIGFDPGTTWGAGLTSTLDHTLRRKSTVSIGDANGSDVFDPAVQWDGYAVDTFDGLGAHTASCSSGGLTLSINDVTLAEGNSGTTQASFTVSLSGPAPAGGVTFDIATADNTATTLNGDYVARSLTGQLIVAGNTSSTFDVTINGDTSVESNETFNVNVTNVTGTGVTLVDGQGLGTITNDDAGTMLIHDIQGTGAQSPLNGQAVTIEGVVVGDYQGTTGLSGFFLQEEDAQIDADPATSEGIFVYDGTFGVAVNVGDVVRVQGTVVEYLTTGVYLTEISPVTAVTVMNSGDSVTPATVNL
ncbi:MAG: lamin tail domain-containing protein, partial [Thermoflexales bacterium]|nr:lamin tail domain-containing protein [Thermoflexales bacterium]